MTASDHAQQRSQRFPLPERGRPQMETGPLDLRVGSAAYPKAIADPRRATFAVSYDYRTTGAGLGLHVLGPRDEAAHRGGSVRPRHRAPPRYAHKLGIEVRAGVGQHHYPHMLTLNVPPAGGLIPSRGRSAISVALRSAGRDNCRPKVGCRKRPTDIQGNGGEHHCDTASLRGVACAAGSGTAARALNRACA